MPIEGLTKVRHVGAWAVKQVVFLSGETRKQDLPQSYTTAAHLRIGTCMSFFLLCISDRRLVGSVGRASVWCGGGRGFEPQSGPTLRVLK